MDTNGQSRWTRVKWRAAYLLDGALWQEVGLLVVRVIMILGRGDARLEERTESKNFSKAHEAIKRRQNRSQSNQRTKRKNQDRDYFASAGDDRAAFCSPLIAGAAG
jgi:hypothetical protein